MCDWEKRIQISSGLVWIPVSREQAFRGDCMKGHAWLRVFLKKDEWWWRGWSGAYSRRFRRRDTGKVMTKVPSQSYARADQFEKNISSPIFAHVRHHRYSLAHVCIPECNSCVYVSVFHYHLWLLLWYWISGNQERASTEMRRHWWIKEEGKEVHSHSNDFSCISFVFLLSDLISK